MQTIFYNGFVFVSTGHVMARVRIRIKCLGPCSEVRGMLGTVLAERAMVVLIDCCLVLTA